MEQQDHQSSKDCLMEQTVFKTIDIVTEESSKGATEPSKIVHSEECSESREISSMEVNSFDSEVYGFNDSLLRGIYQYGFERPSELQQRVIPSILQGRDVVMTARYGSGKSVSYEISLLHKLHSTSTLAIVIVPTVDSAEHNANTMRSIGQHRNVQIHVCRGDKSDHDSIKLTAEESHVVFGTPQHLRHLIDERILSLHCVSVVVLDDIIINPY